MRRAQDDPIFEGSDRLTVAEWDAWIVEHGHLNGSPAELPESDRRAA